MSESRNLKWSLQGMTSLVTGGTKGIGYAVVEELAGFRAIVHTCSRKQTELNDRIHEWQSKGLKVSGSGCDFKIGAQREKLMETVSSLFDAKHNILVNNAGIIRMKKTTEFTAEDSSSMMTTNFEAGYHLCQLAYPHLKPSGNGNIAATSFKVFPLCSFLQGAINQATKNLAFEWAKDNIRVNAVAPYIIRTSLVDDIEEYSEIKELVNKKKSRNPIPTLERLGRFHQP